MMIQKSTLLTCLFVLITSIFFVTGIKDTTQEPMVVTHLTQDTPLTPELHCLAKNVYYEARGEPFEGKLAVATVTMNRVSDPKYPKTICEVVYQKVGKVWQFSWVPHKSGIIENTTEWQDSMIAAKIILTDGHAYDKVANAIFFHATTVNPRWKREKIAQVGKHIFYR